MMNRQFENDDRSHRWNHHLIEAGGTPAPGIGSRDPAIDGTVLCGHCSTGRRYTTLGFFCLFFFVLGRGKYKFCPAPDSVFGGVRLAIGRVLPVPPPSIQLSPVSQ